MEKYVGTIYHSESNQKNKNHCRYIKQKIFNTGIDYIFYILLYILYIYICIARPEVIKEGKIKLSICRKPVLFLDPQRKIYLEASVTCC